MGFRNYGVSQDLSTYLLLSIVLDKPHVIILGPQEVDTEMKSEVQRKRPK